MSKLTRRTFCLGSALTPFVASRFTHAASASQVVNLAIIGCGGQGMSHVGLLAKRNDIRVTHVCDIDSSRSSNAAAQLQREAGSKPIEYQDPRRVFDEDSVDAVLVATPDHWHVPAAIMACEAGKHVYVEKPCSHNVKEGRALISAAQQHKRLVQHGTQCRSARYMQDAVTALREGMIGDIHVARVWNIQRRGNIGHHSPSEPPAHADYDTWLGPAPFLPFQANRFHGHWRWWYAFGCGDFGNDGVHDTDYALWGLGVTQHPDNVVGLGGKYYQDDDQEFPDTQTVICEYNARDGRPAQQLVFEQRLWSSNYPYNTDSGVELMGTAGKMYLSRRGKLQILDSENRPVPLDTELGPPRIDLHHTNFFAAIRGEAQLNADIEVGHRAATVCHLGNLATRLKRAISFDPNTERVEVDAQANAMLGREYRDHWSVPPIT